MSNTKTTTSVLTSHGRGAIAVVRISGTDAVELVDRCFHNPFKPFRKSSFNQIRFGRWNGATGEELVAIQTAEDEVEIHCHGGISASTAILESLNQIGAQRIEAQSIQSRGQSIEAEAWHLLSKATTERTAAILLDQAKGAFARKLQQVIKLLYDDQEAALEELKQLVSWKRLSKHLIQPWHVLLAGPPNVGKSSLINALVGYERAIVYDMPGTTRDAVSAMTAINGWPVQLFDTAGLRDSSDTIESAGIAITKRMIETADLVIAVYDRNHSNWQLPPEADNKPRIRVANKSDLAQDLTSPTDAIATSAVTGEGVQALLDQIAEKLVPSVPRQGEAVPLLASHYETLNDAMEGLNSNDLDSTNELLQALLAAK